MPRLRAHQSRQRKLMNNATTPAPSALNQTLQSLQMPLLAFVTAFGVGGIIIITSDLQVLSAFQAQVSQIGGVIGLLLAVGVLVGALWALRHPKQLWQRISKRAPTGREHQWVQLAAGLGGVSGTLGLLLVFGFGPTLAAAWNAVSTAYGAMIEGSLGNPLTIWAAIQSGDAQAIRMAFYPVLESLVAATPYIFAGLAVAVGFRCGLFNIGAEGQLFVGATCSAFVGYAFTGLPAIVHIPLALLAGAAGGAAWAMLPAILKAKVGAHEVINTMMMNYIAFRLSEWLLNGPMMRPGGTTPVSPNIAPSAELPRFFADPLRFHLGFFIALGVAAFVWWFLFRTTWGFELRTVGASPEAAKYAGMSLTRNYLIAFGLSGALAGLAGANEVLGVNHNLALAFSAGYGFDSIALALLGNSHPLGVVLSALLFGTLRSGGTRMQNVAGIPVDIISVVQALVIAFIAAPAIIQALYRLRGVQGNETTLTRGWGK